MVITQGHLLSGRVLYQQPAAGYRSGLEPVLLAASVPARQGEHILEAGTGAGAALLCLHARVSGVHTLGVEIDEAMAGLAEANARANAFASLQVITGCIEAAALPKSFDHAIANPPYHQPDGSASPVAQRETAKRSSAPLMHGWVGRLSGSLRDRGSLTLIVPTGLVPGILAAMAECRCPATVLFPLWPKAGRTAKLVLLRGLKNARTPMRLSPGLILHKPDGSFTTSAEAVLRDGASLVLDA